MHASLDFTGLEGLADDFLRLEKALQNKVSRQAVAAGARVARDKVRASAPFRTGRLKRGTVASVAKRSETPGEVVAGVRVSAPRKDKEAPYYWVFLEKGTVNMAAQPYIRPAWDNALPQIEGAVISKLAEGIDKAITGIN
ncbi:HK97-gp10 family putative phage morphogenesis protein [Pseudomonas monteilii]|uniref:HK97-gp10 family putative phage morphogenesis protein n=1 Tax=Pseudomonas monteilii TaxID=76759 RepID=UPI001FD16529|nr:HK97-gp10 family putative phage morphogenesis protein [Pseudomonas monteilii]MCJ7854621.1 HK97 gp10 family phage protein [Pseudomonas monteilii]